MIAKLLQLMPGSLLWHVAKRYIAGTDIIDAVRAIRKLNYFGASATVAVLGEHVTTDVEADRMLTEYLRLLRFIKDEELDAQVSVKPSSLGLECSYERYCLRLGHLLTKAEEHSIFVRLDMEDAGLVDDTLRSYRELRAEYPNLGVVLQAHLRRSISDAEQLAQEGANVRLCKGAYQAHPSIAYRKREEIQHNYLQVLRQLLQHGRGFVAIATHDPYLVEQAEGMVRNLEIPKERYGHEMLLGVLEDMRQELIVRKHPMRVYVAYGPAWRAYSIRRFREHPQLFWTIARAMLLGK